MLVLTGADLVLPDSVLHAGTLSIADGRIVEIRAEHAEGAAADLAVLDREGCVVQTYVGGRLVYARRALEGNSPAHPAV